MTNKYRNKITVLGGIKFDSIAEASRYQELMILLRAGKIRELRLQPVFELAPGVIIQGRRRPPLRYIADFKYFDDHRNEIIEDVKGKITEGYRIKRHLMKSVHNIDILETKGGR